jgi:hypothetical protein
LNFFEKKDVFLFLLNLSQGHEMYGAGVRQKLPAASKQVASSLDPCLVAIYFEIGNGIPNSEAEERKVSQFIILELMI